jgi:hypothetical protein
MCVELANVPLNVQFYFEATERKQHPLFAPLFYTTYACWTVFRFVNPIFLFYLLTWKVVPAYSDDDDVRVLMSYICGYFVIVFCSYCHLGIFTVDFIKRLKFGDKWQDAGAGAGEEIDDGLAMLETTTVDNDVSITTTRRMSRAASMSHI